MGKLRQTLRADLEAPEAERALGSGWVSGVLALALALMCLGAVLFLMFPSLFTALPYLRSKRLKALAVAGTERLAACPDVPTLSEAGVPGVAMTQWYALFAPAKTPHAVTRQLNTALNTVLRDPEVTARMQAEGAQVQTSTPGELHDLLLAEGERWQDVVRQTGLRLNMAAD